MRLESLVYSMLAGLPAVQNPDDPADPRAYPLRLPENPVLPALAFLVAGGKPDQTQSGPGLRNPLLRVTMFGRTWDELLELADQVDGLLNGRAQQDIGFSSTLVSENDAEDPQTGMYMRIYEYSAWSAT